ncbi:MAG: PIG-L family deacetylase [Acidobacteria bacterium]|nr:PIG-L family deacetylase [Acidobacteriota bacterium]
MRDKRRILSIHAHPDDAEIMAGGTLALLAGQGHSITIVSMTPGDCGTAEYPPEEISRLRREEARSAAALIGADYVCAEFRDLAIFNDDAARRRVTEILRRVRPEIILTAAPVDYLCDHENTSLLVRDACFAAPAPNYCTGAADPAPALKAIPHLYYMDPAGGVDRDGVVVRPQFIVNVEPVFQTKWDMLACHASQRNWLIRQHGMDDYMETMKAWTTARAQLAGLNRGEGFRQYRGHPYPESPLLQELLAGQVVRL